MHGADHAWASGQPVALIMTATHAEVRQRVRPSTPSWHWSPQRSVGASGCADTITHVGLSELTRLQPPESLARGTRGHGSIIDIRLRHLWPSATGHFRKPRAQHGRRCSAAEAPQLISYTATESHIAQLHKSAMRQALRTGMRTPCGALTSLHATAVMRGTCMTTNTITATAANAETGMHSGLLPSTRRGPTAPPHPANSAPAPSHSTRPLCPPRHRCAAYPHSASAVLLTQPSNTPALNAAQPLIHRPHCPPHYPPSSNSPLPIRPVTPRSTRTPAHSSPHAPLPESQPAQPAAPAPCSPAL